MSLKYNGMFFEYSDFDLKNKVLPDYFSWSEAEYRDMLDWCSKSGLNAVIFLGSQFADLEKYPYMDTEQCHLSRCFGNIVRHAHGRSINVFAGMRIDLSAKFVNSNPDTRIKHSGAARKYSFSSACWCPSNRKVREFIYDCVDNLVNNHRVDGIVLHTSECPDCECPDCRSENVFDLSVEIIRPIYRELQKKRKKLIVIPSAHSRFDIRAAEFKEHFPKALIFPWEYAEPASGATVPVLLPHPMSKRLSKYYEHQKGWLAIPCGNTYMGQDVYPIPEVVRMYCSIARELGVEGIFGYLSYWYPSYINRFAQGIYAWEPDRMDIDTLLEKAAVARIGKKAGKELAHIYSKYVDFIYLTYRYMPGYIRAYAVSMFEFIKSVNPHFFRRLRKNLYILDECEISLRNIDAENSRAKAELKILGRSIRNHKLRIKAIKNFRDSMDFTDRGMRELAEGRDIAGRKSIEKAGRSYERGRKSILKILCSIDNYSEEKAFRKLEKIFRTGILKKIV